ncbi:MAG: DUF222 domain-containing protein [Nigerium sp.]|nr:DUF222 domain-containing protein [Nigerium sp.]
MSAPGIELASVADALAALDHATGMLQAAEIGQALAIASICDQYRVDESKLVEGCERWVRGGADGTPNIGEFIAAEIGANLGVSPASAMVRIARVLNVRHRHPVLWQAVMAGEMRFYEAAQVADACVAAGVNAEACWWLDRQCAIALRIQPWSRVRSKIDAWILMADPALAAERAARAAQARNVGVGRIVDGHCDLWGRLDAADGVAFDQALDALAATLPDGTPADASRLGEAVGAQLSRDHRRAVAVGVLARQALGQSELPRAAQIVVRIDATTGTDAVGVESADSLVLSPVAQVQGRGAVLTTQLSGLLDGCTVTVRPVVDARQLLPAEGYDIPDAMRLAVTERWPVDAFPYGSQRSTACDLDHSKPYGEGGPTEVGNLAPLKRFAHRVRTHGGWKLEQSEPGRLIWTSPHGYTYAVTPAGTVRIGRPPPSEHDWWNQEPPDWLDEPDGIERISERRTRPFLR